MQRKISRYLGDAIIKLALRRGKMAFISGPRQVGKTTQSRLLDHEFDKVIYKNWDEDNFKKIWTKSPNKIIEEIEIGDREKNKLIILDEIHKSKGWKNKLKGIYDTYSEYVKFIITGSARLNVYRKGSDSLMGRYYHFRLHPFSLRELLKLPPNNPNYVEKEIFKESLKKTNAKKNYDLLQRLNKFSGFPEPFLAKDEKILNIWKKGRKEKVIREDLRDLSRVIEIGQIETLAVLLPDKIGSPLSIQSLREDLSVSHDSVTRWLKLLQELYYFFEIRPYSKSITRSLKKNKKIYLFDWTDIESLGARFENIVASHLLKACHYWEDTGEGNFELCYVSNKDKQEVDFLMVKNGKPWFTVECKHSDTSLDTVYKKFQKQLNCPHIQVVNIKNFYRKVDKETYIMSADFFLSLLV